MAIGQVDKGDVLLAGKYQGIAYGAVYFAGLVFLACGMRVGVVTRLALEDRGLLQDLDQAGATLFPVFTRQTTSIMNVLPDPLGDARRCYSRGFAGTFRAGDLPAVQARLYYVGTIMPDEIDLGFLRAVASRGPVALDPQGCLRRLQGDELLTERWEWAGDALPLVRFLKVDDREALALTGKNDYRRAAECLAASGPREIVLTHREGLLVLADGRFYEAPFRPRSLAGRSGRGDTCFASYLSRRLLGEVPERATRFAAALTTLKLEKPGPFRGSLADVQNVMETL